MSQIFRTIRAMQKMRIEFVDDAVDEIIRLRAHNEKLLNHARRLERMIEFGAANKEDLLAEVRSMREEDGPCAKIR